MKIRLTNNSPPKQHYSANDRKNLLLYFIHLLSQIKLNSDVMDVAPFIKSI